MADSVADAFHNHRTADVHLPRNAPLPCRICHSVYARSAAKADRQETGEYPSGRNHHCLIDRSEPLLR